MSTFYKTLFALCFLVLCQFTFANNSEHSTKKLENTFGDERLEKLCQIATEVASSNPDLAENLSLELIKLSNKKAYRYKGLGYYNLGEAYFYKEMYDDALNSYQQAEPYFILTKDSTHIAANYSNMALIHYYNANYNKSLSLYEKSLQIETLTNDSIGMAQSYQNIALIFGNRNKFDIQRSYFQKALDIYLLQDDKKSVADILLNLGVAATRLEDYDSTIRYYNDALKTYQQLNDSNRIASVQYNMGCLYLRTKDYSKANDYFTEATSIFEELGDKTGMIHAYTGLGDILAAQGNKNAAIEMYMQCETLNKEVGLLEPKMNNLYSLFKTYKEIGDSENALRVLENYLTIKDSIYNTEQNNKILELENKYKFQKSQNEVSKLSARNRLYVIFISIILFLLIIALIYGIYFYRTKRLNEKQRLLQLEQKVLRTQMNPHFIFNSLSAIQCYILDNKTFDAVDFLADFAGLIRLVLQNSQYEYITLNEEREILEHYISLQNRRFGDTIQYQIKIDEALNNSTIMIPPMLAQPFIENSFEHGELYKKENSEITVRFERKAKKLYYCIEDNGIGYDITKAKQSNTSKKHKSLALQITKERLKLINRSNNNGKVHLKVEDRSKYGEEGTRVEFTIPLIEKN
jgi:tetratricopeptide (TPR) repeat protein